MADANPTVGELLKAKTDPDAEVWRYTFEPGPDFSLSVRGQIIGRVLRIDTMPAAATARWFWSITCVRQFIGMTKPSKTDSGFFETKDEAVQALRAAWALERDWRAEMRALTPYHDAGMTHWVGLVAWEGYERPSTAEFEILEGVGRDLGLDAMKPWAIYQDVCREVAPTDANRDERIAEVRRRLIAFADSAEERPWCVVRLRDHGPETKKGHSSFGVEIGEAGLMPASSFGVAAALGQRRGSQGSKTSGLPPEKTQRIDEAVSGQCSGLLSMHLGSGTPTSRLSAFAGRRGTSGSIR